MQSAGRGVAGNGISVDEDAETRARHGSRLAGHSLAEALALKSGGQVGIAAAEKAGEKFHDTLSMQQSYTGCLRIVA